MAHGAYNDGTNSCGAAGAPFIIHALELPSANGERGGRYLECVSGGGKYL